MTHKTLFEKLFDQAHTEANAAYDAAPTKEEAYDAYRERMERFGREYPKHCHPLRYATRLLAEGTREEWVEYLGEPRIASDAPDEIVVRCLATEASLEPVYHYQEQDGVAYHRFLRGVRAGRYGRTVEDIQFAAEIVLGGLA